MITPYLTRQILLSAAVTAACLAGAFGILLDPGAAAAQDPIQPSCTNTECRGTTFCRHTTGLGCSINSAGTSCTNTVCG